MSSKEDDRKQRLAAALRENLLKRKAQARAIAATDDVPAAKGKS